MGSMTARANGRGREVQNRPTGGTGKGGLRGEGGAIPPPHAMKLHLIDCTLSSCVQFRAARFFGLSVSLSPLHRFPPLLLTSTHRRACKCTFLSHSELPRPAVGLVMPCRSHDCPAAIAGLVQECMANEPGVRPTARQLVLRIEHSMVH